MKFTIRRTSDWEGKRPPCDGAQRRSEVDEYENATWSIEIGTLEDLLALRKQLGTRLIILDDDTLEIYDDYRE